MRYMADLRYAGRPMNSRPGSPTTSGELSIDEIAQAFRDQHHRN